MTRSASPWRRWSSRSPTSRPWCSRHQGVRLSYWELGAEVERVARGLARRRDRDRRPRRHLGADLRRVDAAAVRVRPGRRDPRQREPGVPAERARVRAPPLGRAAARHRSVVQDVRLPRDARRRARRAPPARDGRHDRRRVSGRRAKTSSGRRWSSWATAIPADQVALPRAAARHRRPDQHPVHERHDRQPEGRHAHASQHLEQRPGHGRATWATRSIDRVCIPVPLYHCFGMGIGNLGCIASGATMVYPARRLRPAGDARGDGRGAVHGRVRRPDDVHRDARAPAVRGVRHSRRCAPGSWRARRARSR